MTEEVKNEPNDGNCTEPNDGNCAEREDSVGASESSHSPAQPATPHSPAQPTTPPDGDADAAASDAAPAVDVILASGSPRRRDLLEREGVTFTVRTSEVDETLEPDLLADPPEAAKKLAERKAGAVVQEVLGEGYTGMAAIIGADTMVVCDNQIFGKPKNLSDAKHMLRQLQGRTHEVMTAVSVWLVAAPNAEDVSLGFRTFVDTAAVTFHPQTDEQLADYLKLGESFDKAGAYAAQGEGKRMIKHISGDIDTVIGLPVKRLLKEFPDLVQSGK